MIKNRILRIVNKSNEFGDLYSIEFLQYFDIYRLEIEYCENIVPKFQNKSLRQLLIHNSLLKRVDELPLADLEVLQLIKPVSCRFYCYIDNSKLNIEGIQKCQKLKFLSLQNQKDIDIINIKNLVTLTKLDLENCFVTDLDVLASLVNLEELILSGNRGIDLSALKYFQKLEVLILEKCGMKNGYPRIKSKRYSKIDLSNIQSLKQLHSLNLNGCCLQNINVLQSNDTLKQLVLSCNSGIDISSLQFMNSLDRLELQGCRITSIRALKSLIQLKELDISSNNFIDITAIQYLKQLKYLNIRDCEIRDITVLSALTHLNYLDMSWNSVVYLSPLFTLKLKYLYTSDSLDSDEYQASNNQLCWKQCGECPDYSIMELQYAKIYWNVNAPITQLRQMSQKRVRFLSKLKIFQLKVNENTNLNVKNGILFTKQIVELFQRMNTRDNWL
ncbi:leucine-rich_repeat domain-containing protein [Hexamita inflata]|uniref:Leucine-rich repeat domain-containing protein n=1 Tax=Hexamita inflata TaxID=28002 RepID=A0AA86N8U4_9EUKA|nr:leucine-rich repeat domain-containing protein [Hexamita inflata]